MLLLARRVGRVYRWSVWTTKAGKEKQFERKEKTRATLIFGSRFDS
jgi:hypothetical protein